MIYGIGTDLVRIGRLDEVIRRWKGRFLGRVFTEREVAACSKRASTSAFALRFAAKEAFSKAVGLGMTNGLKWREIEVYNEPSGKPRLKVWGRAEEICREREISGIHLSLSDEGDYAAAVVVLEREAAADPAVEDKGGSFRPMKASDIMTTEVITVKKETSLKELAKLLEAHHINGVPVVDDQGGLIGIICESDLIRKDKKLHIPTVVAFVDMIFYLESSKVMEKEINRLTATEVGELYTKDVVTVDKDTPVEEIAEIMSNRKIYTIPVMDKGSMVGVIGKADVIKTLVS